MQNLVGQMKTTPSILHYVPTITILYVLYFKISFRKHITLIWVQIFLNARNCI